MAMAHRGNKYYDINNNERIIALRPYDSAFSSLYIRSTYRVEVIQNENVLPRKSRHTGTFPLLCGNFVTADNTN